jgi:S1-C subfamily serine protease
LPALALALATLSGFACKSADLPRTAPPLADMREPPALFAEPDDEAARRALPAGSFSGVTVSRAGQSLDALIDQGLDAPAGVAVERVVENSPGARAGLEPGDLLLEARTADGPALPLAWPSEWRALELETPPGTEIELLVDRAGAERATTLVLEPRVRPAERAPVDRLREEQRVGVVVRGTTEVEARALGLGPGAGAVVVGLSAASPWRSVGIVFEDVIVAVDGRPVGHPGALLDAIREARKGDRLALVVARDGERFTVDAPLSRRARELSESSLPPLWNYTSDADETRLSLVLGAFVWRKTDAAWRVRLLWLLGFGGGAGDELVEVDG